MRRVELSPEDINQLAQNIWEAMFSVGLEVAGHRDTDPAEFLTGSIHINGAWKGVVVLRGSIPLARKLTSLMLGMEAPEDAETCDAMGELTNLMAGAAQTLLPAPSELTPPSVIEGEDDKVVLPHFSMVNEVHFSFYGEPLTVMIFQADQQPAASQTSLERENNTAD